MRDKSRDLFDFGSILEHNVLSIDEITELFSKVDNKIGLTDDIINFIKSKQEPKDDEAVYLSEYDRIDLIFDENEKHNNKLLSYISEQNKIYRIKAIS